MNVRDVLSALGTQVAGSVRVVVKTNLGPAFVVYDGPAQDAGASLPARLGVKAAVTVYGPDGSPLYQSGQPPATEPLRAALALAVVVGLGFLILRGLRPR